MSDHYAPPAGPPPNYRDRQSSGQESHDRDPGLSAHNPLYRNREAITHQSNSDAPPDYQPPPGPPASWQDDKKQPGDDDAYAAPPDPPPSHPSGNEPEPPPYDPWLAVPDNALLPPPPSFKEETSPTANASYDDAARGHAWCRQNPLWRSQRHSPQTLQRLASSDVHLTMPPGTRHTQLNQQAIGRTHVLTSSKCTDTIFLSDLPIYAASAPHSATTTIYYELKVLSMGHGNRHGDADAGIALGFVAPPYPSWRLPGWHRASLGVHGDDGRRYVDDSYGGKDFTQSFRKNVVVGLGMTFSPPTYQGGKKRIEVFFTRNGKRDGGWDLHEEKDRDQEEGDVTGLEGAHDLLAAVGCFGGVEFEVRFRREEWMFRP